MSVSNKEDSSKNSIHSPNKQLTPNNMPSNQGGTSRSPNTKQYRYANASKNHMSLVVTLENENEMANFQQAIAKRVSMVDYSPSVNAGDELL